MAIIVKTDSPRVLISEINKKIKKGEILGWCVDEDGDYHPSTYDVRAWLSPQIKEEEIVFGIIGRRDIDMTKITYGEYCGRFASMLLVNFDDMFDDVKITALLVENTDK